jgi:hypothetical protein
MIIGFIHNPIGLNPKKAKLSMRNERKVAGFFGKKMAELPKDAFWVHLALLFCFFQRAKYFISRGSLNHLLG